MTTPATPTHVNPLQNAGLTQRELQALALHCFDGFALRAIADLQGCDHVVVSRRLKAGIRKLLRAGFPAACVYRPLVKVTAVSKLGRDFERGHAGLNELAGD